MLATGMTQYLGALWPLSAPGLKVAAIGTIIVLAIVNALGVRLGAGLTRILAWLKLGLLAFVVLWGFGRGLGDWSNFVPFTAQRPGSDPLPKALIGAFILAFFSFAGWWDMSKVAGEVREPTRTMPRALMLGTMVVTAVYIAISAVFLYLVPAARVTADNQGFATLAGEALFGSSGARFFSAIVVAVVLGQLASVIMAAPRVYYAMARDGLFLPGVANLHPRFGTPARAIAIQASLASLLVLSGTFEEILAYFFFTVVYFIGLIVASGYGFARRRSAPDEPRTPGYPVTPLVFLLPVVVLLVLLATDQPVRVLCGAGIVALGLPVYHLAFRKETRGGLA
jgi:APA family basic amino acid/polyamine antiporter